MRIEREEEKKRTAEEFRMHVRTSHHISCKPGRSLVSGSPCYNTALLYYRYRSYSGLAQKRLLEKSRGGLTAHLLASMPLGLREYCGVSTLDISF